MLIYLDGNDEQCRELAKTLKQANIFQSNVIIDCPSTEFIHYYHSFMAGSAESSAHSHYNSSSGRSTTGSSSGQMRTANSFNSNSRAFSPPRASMHGRNNNSSHSMRGNSVVGSSSKHHGSSSSNYGHRNTEADLGDQQHNNSGQSSLRHQQQLSRDKSRESSSSSNSATGGASGGNGGLNRSSSSSSSHGYRSHQPESFGEIASPSRLHRDSSPNVSGGHAYSSPTINKSADTMGEHRSSRGYSNNNNATDSGDDIHNAVRRLNHSKSFPVSGNSDRSRSPFRDRTHPTSGQQHGLEAELNSAIGTSPTSLRVSTGSLSYFGGQQLQNEANKNSALVGGDKTTAEKDYRKRKPSIDDIPAGSNGNHREHSVNDLQQHGRSLKLSSSDGVILNNNDSLDSTSSSHRDHSGSTSGDRHRDGHRGSLHRGESHRSISSTGSPSLSLSCGTPGLATPTSTTYHHHHQSRNEDGLVTKRKPINDGNNELLNQEDIRKRLLLVNNEPQKTLGNNISPKLSNTSIAGKTNYQDMNGTRLTSFGSKHNSIDPILSSRRNSSGSSSSSGRGGHLNTTASVLVQAAQSKCVEYMASLSRQNTNGGSHGHHEGDLSNAIAPTREVMEKLDRSTHGLHYGKGHDPNVRIIFTEKDDPLKMYMGPAREELDPRPKRGDHHNLFQVPCYDHLFVLNSWLKVMPNNVVICSVHDNAHENEHRSNSHRMNSFSNSYASGNIPSPSIACNRTRNSFDLGRSDSLSGEPLDIGRHTPSILSPTRTTVPSSFDIAGINTASRKNASNEKDAAWKGTPTLNEEEKNRPLDYSRFTVKKKVPSGAVNNASTSSLTTNIGVSSITNTTSTVASSSGHNSHHNHSNSSNVISPFSSFKETTGSSNLPKFTSTSSSIFDEDSRRLEHSHDVVPTMDVEMILSPEPRLKPNTLSSLSGSSQNRLTLPSGLVKTTHGLQSSPFTTPTEKKSSQFEMHLPKMSQLSSLTSSTTSSSLTTNMPPIFSGTAIFNSSPSSTVRPNILPFQRVRKDGPSGLTSSNTTSNNSNRLPNSFLSRPSSNTNTSQLPTNSKGVTSLASVGHSNSLDAAKNKPSSSSNPGLSKHASLGAKPNENKTGGDSLTVGHTKKDAVPKQHPKDDNRVGAPKPLKHGSDQKMNHEDLKSKEHRTQQQRDPEIKSKKIATVFTKDRDESTKAKTLKGSDSSFPSVTKSSKEQQQSKDKDKSAKPKEKEREKDKKDRQRAKVMSKKDKEREKEKSKRVSISSASSSNKSATKKDNKNKNTGKSIPNSSKGNKGKRQDKVGDGVSEVDFVLTMYDRIKIDKQSKAALGKDEPQRGKDSKDKDKAGGSKRASIDANDSYQKSSSSSSSDDTSSEDDDSDDDEEDTPKVQPVKRGRGRPRQPVELESDDDDNDSSSSSSYESDDSDDADDDDDDDDNNSSSDSDVPPMMPVGRRNSKLVNNNKKTSAMSNKKAAKKNNDSDSEPDIINNRTKQKKKNMVRSDSEDEEEASPAFKRKVSKVGRPPKNREQQPQQSSNKHLNKDKDKLKNKPSTNLNSSKDKAVAKPNKSTANEKLIKSKSQMLMLSDTETSEEELMPPPPKNKTTANQTHHKEKENRKVSKAKISSDSDSDSDDEILRKKKKKITLTKSDKSSKDMSNKKLTKESMASSAQQQRQQKKSTSDSNDGLDDLAASRHRRQSSTSSNQSMDSNAQSNLEGKHTNSKQSHHHKSSSGSKAGHAMQPINKTSGSSTTHKDKQQKGDRSPSKKLSSTSSSTGGSNTRALSPQKAQKVAPSVPVTLSKGSRLEDEASKENKKRKKSSRSEKEKSRKSEHHHHHQHSQEREADKKLTTPITSAREHSVATSTAPGTPVRSNSGEYTKDSSQPPSLSSSSNQFQQRRPSITSPPPTHANDQLHSSTGGNKNSSNMIKVGLHQPEFAQLRKVAEQTTIPVLPKDTINNNSTMMSRTPPTPSVSSTATPMLTPSPSPVPKTPETSPPYAVDVGAGVMLDYHEVGESDLADGKHLINTRSEQHSLENEAFEAANFSPKLLQYHHHQQQHRQRKGSSQSTSSSSSSASSFGLRSPPPAPTTLSKQVFSSGSHSSENSRSSIIKHEEEEAEAAAILQKQLEFEPGHNNKSLGLKSPPPPISFDRLAQLQARSRLPPVSPHQQARNSVLVVKAEIEIDDKIVRSTPILPKSSPQEIGLHTSSAKVTEQATSLIGLETISKPLPIVTPTTTINTDISDIDSQRRLEDNLAVEHLLQNEFASNEEEVLANDTNAQVPMHDFMGLLPTSRTPSLDLTPMAGETSSVSSSSLHSSPQPASVSTATVAATISNRRDSTLSVGSASLLPPLSTPVTLNEISSNNNLITNLPVVDDQELRAAVQEIELSSSLLDSSSTTTTTTLKEEIQQQTSILKPLTINTSAPLSEKEYMFSDDEDEIHTDQIVDQSALAKSLLDDDVDISDDSNTNVSGAGPSSQIPAVGDSLFLRHQPSMLFSPTGMSSSSTTFNTSTTSELPSFSNQVKNLSMPLLSTCYDTASNSSTGNKKSTPLASPPFSFEVSSGNSKNKPSLFSSFLSPSSSSKMPSTNIEMSPPTSLVGAFDMNTNTAPSITDDLLSLSKHEQDSCSASVISDKTEIEDENTICEPYEEQQMQLDDKMSISDESGPRASKRTHEEMMINVGQAESESSAPVVVVPPVTKGKRGRKAKNRKLSESSHSPKSDTSIEHHQQQQLSINTNFSMGSSGLFSPNSISPGNITSSGNFQLTTEISPGSQAKKLKLQQQQQHSYSIRRSGRSTAHPTVGDGGDAEMDERIDDQQQEPEQGHPEEPVVKKSKRGRKKKIQTEPSSNANAYDVFEFTDEEGENDLSTTKAPKLGFGEERMLQQSHDVTNALTTSTPVSQISPKSLVVSKEYHAERTQNLKIKIRLNEERHDEVGKQPLQQHHQHHIATRNLVIEDSKSNDSFGESHNSSMKPVRKSARLAKAPIEEMGEDIGKHPKKSGENEAGAKRVTRSYGRKSDDLNTPIVGQEVVDETDGKFVIKLFTIMSNFCLLFVDGRTGSSRRTTRSRGGNAETEVDQQQPPTSFVSPVPPLVIQQGSVVAKLPKKPLLTNASHFELTAESTPVITLSESLTQSKTLGDVSGRRESAEQQLTQPAVVSNNEERKDEAKSNLNSGSLTLTLPPKKAISPPVSVIQSTGNVEKIVTPIVPIESSPLSTPRSSPSLASASGSIANQPGTATPFSVISTTPASGASTTAFSFQDIPATNVEPNNTAAQQQQQQQQKQQSKTKHAGKFRALTDWNDNNISVPTSAPVSSPLVIAPTSACGVTTPPSMPSVISSVSTMATSSAISNSSNSNLLPSNEPQPVTLVAKTQTPVGQQQPISLVSGNKQVLNGQQQVSPPPAHHFAGPLASPMVSAVDVPLRPLNMSTTMASTTRGHHQPQALSVISSPSGLSSSTSKSTRAGSSSMTGSHHPASQSAFVSSAASHYATLPPGSIPPRGIENFNHTMWNMAQQQQQQPPMMPTAPQLAWLNPAPPPGTPPEMWEAVYKSHFMQQRIPDGGLYSREMEYNQSKYGKNAFGAGSSKQSQQQQQQEFTRNPLIPHHLLQRFQQMSPADVSAFAASLGGMPMHPGAFGMTGGPKPPEHVVSPGPVPGLAPQPVVPAPSLHPFQPIHYPSYHQQQQLARLIAENEQQNNERGNRENASRGSQANIDRGEMERRPSPQPSANNQSNQPRRLDFLTQAFCVINFRTIKSSTALHFLGGNRELALQALSELSRANIDDPSAVIDLDISQRMRLEGEQYERLKQKIYVSILLVHQDFGF